MDASDKPRILLPRLARRIAEKGASAGARTVLMVAFGDSVTQGWQADGVLDQEGAYHAQVLHELRRRHPMCNFDGLNAGAGGETLETALVRLGRDVISHQPDLVLVAFGLNDSAAGEAGVAAFRKRLDGLLSALQSEAEAEAVLLTPNMMCHADNPRVSERWRHALPALRERQVKGVLARYAAAIREAGAACGAPVADVYAEWERLRGRGADTDALLDNGLNHPGAEGHALAARVVLATLYSG
jgi:acyl-CoA thioesterase-1